jgi:opacity protein-like surface antigen
MKLLRVPFLVAFWLRALVLAGILIMMSELGSAQKGYWDPEPEPSIVATAGAVENANLAQPGQSYGVRDVGLRASVPLIGGWDWDQGEAAKFRLLASVGFRVGSALIPYTIGRQRLYASDVGFSGVHVLNPKNQITWSIRTGFWEEDATVSSPKIRETGSVVAAYRKSDSLTLLYGGAYSYVLGQGKPLPVFGFRWRSQPATTVSILGPFSGQVHQRLGQRLMVGVEAGLSGNQFHIANNQEFSSPTNNLYMRLREVRAGGRVGVRLNQSLALLGEAGVAADRKLTFADGNTALSSLDVPAKPYVSISLRYSFSKKRHWEDFGKW